MADTGMNNPNPSGRRMVHVKRTGDGPNDWSLKFEDGSELPPIAALSIDIAPGEFPSLILDVVDVNFEGSLPPLWRVDFQTLVEMVADAGCEMNALGELGHREDVIRVQEKTIAGLREAGATLVDALRMDAKALTAAMEEIDRLKGELAQAHIGAANLSTETIRAQEGWADANRKVARLSATLGEFRANNVALLKARDEDRHVIDSLASERNKLSAERHDLVNQLNRARRSAELCNSIRANHDWHAARSGDLTFTDCDKIVDAARADLAHAFGKREIDYQNEIRHLKEMVVDRECQISAGKLLVLEAEDSLTRCRKYEEENHLLKRRISLGEVDAVPAAAVPAERQRFKPMIVTSDGTQADFLRRQGGDAINVQSIQNLYGHRSDLIIVLPPLPHQAASARFMESYGSALEQSVPTRLVPGGKLIRL